MESCSPCVFNHQTEVFVPKCIERGYKYKLYLNYDLAHDSRFIFSSQQVNGQNFAPNNLFNLLANQRFIQFNMITCMSRNPSFRFVILSDARCFLGTVVLFLIHPFRKLFKTSLVKTASLYVSSNKVSILSVGYETILNN